MNVDMFYKAPKDLMSCSGVIGNDGKQYKLDLAEKNIFVHMIDKCNQFKGNHYETQATIADAFDLEVRVAAKALKTLVSSGLVKAKKERNHSISPHLCWYYTGVDTSLETYKIERVSRTTRESRSKKVVDNKPEQCKIEYIEDIPEWMK
jgi:predicted transcriptional regulator